MHTDDGRLEQLTGKVFTTLSRNFRLVKIHRMGALDYCEFFLSYEFENEIPHLLTVLEEFCLENLVTSWSIADGTIESVFENVLNT